MLSYDHEKLKIYCGDSAQELLSIPDKSAQCCITSPPYFQQRNYQVEGQFGSEYGVAEFNDNLMLVLTQLHRVLREDGIIWWNQSDGFDTNGCLTMQHYKLILRAISELGFILRNILIWNKTNSRPEPFKNRLSRVYEPVFVLVKNKDYYFNLDAIRQEQVSGKFKREHFTDIFGAEVIIEDNGRRDKIVGKGKGQKIGAIYGRVGGYSEKGKNPGDLWNIPTERSLYPHYAAFASRLIAPMILAGSREGDMILDPFAGSFTCGEVALKLKRRFTGIELNPEYVNTIGIPRLRDLVDVW